MSNISSNRDQKVKRWMTCRRTLPFWFCTQINMDVSIRDIVSDRKCHCIRDVASESSLYVKKIVVVIFCKHIYTMYTSNNLFIKFIRTHIELIKALHF